MVKISELSVFLPTYNEEGNIKNVVLNVKKVLEKTADKWEILIVDDGSKDNTSKIASELAKSDSRIRTIRHKVNEGYGGALKTGFENAKYEWVAFMDADGQFDFNDINKFLEKKDAADLILGIRKNRADSIFRKIFTFGWSLIAKIMLGLSASDYSCGFKMIKKSVYKSITPLVGEEKVTQIEMLVKAKKMGYKFAEVKVNHYPRVTGKQTGANINVVIKSVLDLFKLWAKLNGVTIFEILAVLAILVIGAFLRLYKIDGYMTFLGDEGRDVIIVRKFLVEHHPPLIGPGTSIGNMYLGPLYYYMMAPALLLANFSPVGPAVMVALLGVATIAFVWWVSREWFPNSFQGQSSQVNWGALTAAGLYAVSPTVITYSHSSWNPNIMPFFALLSIYSIWKVWRQKEFNWLIVLGISFAFVLQSHYLGLLLLPVIGLYWLLGLLQNKNTESSKPYIQYTIYAAVAFAILMSPLLFFDLRHNFQNFKAMEEFVLTSSQTFSGSGGGIVNFVKTFELVNTRLVTGQYAAIGVVAAVLFMVALIWLIIKKRTKELILLLLWFFVGIFGLASYKGSVFDHYMGFLFPVPFLLIGAITQFMLSRLTPKTFTFFGKAGYSLLSFTLISLFIVNLLNNPFRYPPNNQLARSIEIASFIRDKAEGRRFNLATLSEMNNRDVYQYFLLLWGAKVVDTDQNSVFYTVTDQLFVVCERPKEKCDPTHDPSAWITNFGWSKIIDSWQVAGVNIYKLGHAK